ncbi:hypothetical protein QFC20_001255 [Naganishia adeliensis]|uniref:Uncharacterized protein n=1 Tax=Naganishia adeliensis TaxID=92952 RepID=A0ACC2WTQ5_9TREE|nr:hypothetical protein QFC20_001255 [Naganishia adeliensis]
MNDPSPHSARHPNNRQDTTEYEETVPLASASEISRTMSRDSGSKIHGVGEHPRRVYWSFWLLGAVILLSWNAATAVTAFPLLPAVFPILPAIPYFFALTGLTLVFSYATSYLQSSVLAVAALWGPKEMLAVMSGQGGIAVLISAVQVYIAAMGVFTSDDSEPKDPSDGSPTTAELAAGMGLWMAAIVPTAICILTTRRLFPRDASSGHHRPNLSFEQTPDDGEFYDTERRFSAEEDEDSRRGSTNGFNRSWAIMKRNKVINFSVAYVFIVTLAVFPSITTSIISVRQPPPKYLEPGLFIPLHFLMFNVSDYLGRTYLPTIPWLFLQEAKHVMFASLARTLFIPIFIMCNTVFISTSVTRHIPFINSDVLYFAILFLFGATNGWISSLSMIIASSPSLNPAIEEDEKDVAGSLAGFCLTGGLVLGSLASFIIGWIVKR